jgi:CotH kinase protein
MKGLQWRLCASALAATIGGSAGCSSGADVKGTPDGGPLPAGSMTGASAANGHVSDAGGSARLCPDLFDQSVVSAYSFEISADNWAKLDADFHDLTDVLAGNPPQTYYPIVFHYGSETVSNAAVRLRGKSSWVDTVMFDANPKMQFDISFDQADATQKFHGVSTLHLEVARDDWTFLNERIGNNWFREIGLVAPCANSATVTINGVLYGLYVAEEGVNKSLLKQFYPGNADGDLFKGGTELQSSAATVNWARLQALNAATDIATLATLVDLPNTVLEWAAEAVVEDADGYYGGAHNYYLYDQGSAGYVWLLDHTDSAFEWIDLFTSLGPGEHPIYWWAGRPLPDPPGADYLLVMNDPTWRAQYVQAIATQLAKWNTQEIQGWIDTWSQQIASAVAADPHKWATMDQFTTAVAAMRTMAQARPAYLQTFLACENGDPTQATDQDGDGVPWCNDCDDTNPSVTTACAPTN